MSFLEGLNGSVAGALICILLFVDEAGIPLPFAPNEALLLLTGVLVAGSAFPLWVMLPLAFLAMTAGMISGYGWARTIGQSGLQSLAERLHATDVYDRATSRLKTASPGGIAVSRMIPGLRPYVTLVAGAAEVDIRTFLIGALPALLVWEIALIAAGMVVGLPIEHLLGRFQKIVARGAVLVALGAVVWFAVRDPAPDQRNGIASLAPRMRASLAVAVDAGIVGSVVGGLFAMSHRILDIRANPWIQVLVAAVLLLALLLAARRIRTPGETLFDTHYWHHPSPPSR